MAFFILTIYGILASMWMFYMTDGDVRKLRLFVAGVATGTAGMWLAAYLAKRKKDERE